MAQSPKIPEDFFAAPQVHIEHRADGVLIVEPTQELGPYARCLGEYLIKWGNKTPDRVFLAQRNGAGQWRGLTYGDALDQVTRLAAALLRRGLGPDRPVAILSGNSISHALVMLAAMHVGIPVAQLSPAYSLLSQDFAKLRHVLSLARPGLIYVEAAKPFEAALSALDLTDVHLLCTVNDGDVFDFRTIDALRDEVAEPSDIVAPAFEAVTPDTVAKILFTSGSTGNPKGVKNTQKMLCSNQQSMTQCWPFLNKRPPVLVDWLPWSHTFGSNHNFNMVLRHGGSLYIDGGKPAPGAIETTIKNIKSISPTIYFNVPAGYEALLPHLETDPEFARCFFNDLDVLFYAAAALPQASWRRLEAIALKTMGRKPVFSSAWGSTETSPLATSVHFPITKAGTIGLPVPGVSLKMVPVGDSFELRLKGANITPGYWREPELSAKAFDEEGYYLMGDAGKFEDPDNPAAGIVFDGRLGENFKLRSGTWVNVGKLRVAAIDAAKPLIRDAVVAGHNEEYVSLLIFPDEAGCREIANAAHGEMPLAEVLAHSEVRAGLKAKLLEYNKKHPASSTRVRRALLMAEAPEIDAGETTDKGYINQHGVLTRRARLVEQLYQGHPDVINIDD
ncbi:MAG: feruloyl-CoA synthase [Sphingomonadales bacterium]